LLYSIISDVLYKTDSIFLNFNACIVYFIVCIYSGLDWGKTTSKNRYEISFFFPCRDEKQQTDSIQQDSRDGDKYDTETHKDQQHPSSPTTNAASAEDSLPSSTQSHVPHTEAPGSIHEATPITPPTFSPPEEEVPPLPEPPLESDEAELYLAGYNGDGRREENKDNVESESVEESRVLENNGEMVKNNKHSFSTPDTVSEGKDNHISTGQGAQVSVEEIQTNAEDDSTTRSASSPGLQSQEFPAEKISDSEGSKEKVATAAQLGPGEDILSSNTSSGLNSASSDDQICEEDSCSKNSLKVEVEDVGENSSGDGTGESESSDVENLGGEDDQSNAAGGDDKDASGSESQSSQEEKENLVKVSSSLEMDAKGQVKTEEGDEEDVESVGVAGEEEKEEEGRPGEESDEDKEPVDEDDQVLTFEEFKNKLMEEGGGQVQRPPDLGGVAPPSGKKTTLTNYASVDCGAKVVEANPEAQVCRQ